VELVDGDNYRLGKWVSHRRSDYQVGRLPQERIDALEAVPGWVWDPFETDFQEGLAALVQYVSREGHARVPEGHVELVDGDNYRLGTWAAVRRKDFRVGRLSQERIAVLEALPGWAWDQLEAQLEAKFQEGLAVLQQFVAREGHAIVSKRHVELVDGVNHRLGGWVSNRRSGYNAGRLSKERIAALEAVPGWVWSTR
jgi:hypothetical protein